MTLLHRTLRVFAGLTAVTAFSAAITIPFTTHANTFLWTAGSGTDTNWSTAANWSPSGPPGPGDTAVFGSGATSSSATTVNNALSTSMIVSNLLYTNTTSGDWHVTDIPAGVTLAATNVTIGGISGAFLTDVAMTDAGTFSVYGNLSIGDLPSSGNQISVVDLGGLSNFVFNSSGSTINIGPANYSLADVTLAASNTITAATFNDNLNDSSSSSTTTLVLGGTTNNFNIGTINIAAGRNSTTVSFPAGSTGGLRIRGAGGTDSSFANMTLGYHNTSGSGSHAVASLSFTGNPMDIRLGTLILGRSDHTPTGTSYGQGTIAFDTGAIYASNIVMATTVGAVESSSQYFAQGIGGIIVGANGTLFIGPGGAALVDQTNNATSSANSTGGIIINQGTVIASNSIVKINTSGIGSITNYSGTLDMVSGTIGTPAIPLDNFYLSGGTLHLNVNGSSATPIANVTTLFASGATITVDSVANVSIPTVIHLIGYNTSSDDQYSGFTLSPLPAGYTGSLVDNSGYIDLSIEPAGSSVAPLVWVGAVGSTLNSSWDLATHDWKNTNGVATAYANPDFVHFDDSASNSIVTLDVTNLTPTSVTFTNQGVANNGLDYTLNGTGYIGGSVGLFKDGVGSVTLAESGGDNFKGGVTVNNGTVVLDDANGAITGGFSINYGATLQVGNNNANGIVPPGTLLDNGTLIVNQSSSEQVTNPIVGSGSLTKEGSGTLTLTGTNGFTGSTTVSGGVLALSGAGTISNSTSVTVNGATLDVTGVTGTTLLSDSLNTINSTLNVAVSGLTPPVQVVNGSWTMGGTGNTVNVTALPPIASYPTTLTLAQCPYGISSFNMTLGTLPSGTPAFAGSVSLSSDSTSVLLTLTAGPVSVRPSVVWIGTNYVSVTTNWSDRLNWQLPGAPTTVDNVVFGPNTVSSGSPFSSVGDGSGGIVNAANINNIVDTTFTIGTLDYTNVGGSSLSQNTFIANGATLNVVSNGSLTVGSFSSSVDFGAGATEFVTIGGANGTLNVNNTNGTFYVGLGNGSSGTEMATLDLSGLGTFNASVSRFMVGVGSGSLGLELGRVAGTVYLAQTNTITASIGVTNTEIVDPTANTVAFDVGEDDGNAGMSCFLYLGQTNAIFADAIGVGREKVTSTMAFNPNLIGSSTRLWAYFRGASTNAVATWSVGDQVDNSGSGENANGVNDFTGGHVDALVNTMYIGRSSIATGGSGTNSGVLTFDNGSINVATLYAGYQPTNSSKASLGIINVNTNATLGTFGTLSVSSNLNLGVTYTGGTAATGTLNVDGGTVIASNIVCGGVSAINLSASGNGGALNVSGALGAVGAPLGSLNLNGNTVLKLPANSSAAAVVNNLTIDGQSNTTNVLNISSVAAITPPAELPVIQYTTLGNNGGTFNLGLGSLPAHYSGYFTNDTVHSAIAVVITSAPAVAPSTNAEITAVSLSGTNLIVQGTNNNVPNTSFHYVVLTSTNLALPLSDWTVVVTNTFNSAGTFDYTNPIVPGSPRQFIDVQAVP